MAQASDEQDLFSKLVDQGEVKGEQLLKDEEILNDEDKKKPDNTCNPTGKTEGLETKPKKACANCTCGLAEELEKGAQEKTNSAAANPAKSSCGSCYLGDAFRCASCPYRGTPAFKPGEKVVIDTASDDI